MISRWFIISEPHHSPAIAFLVPVNLNNTIVKLFAGLFHPSRTAKSSAQPNADVMSVIGPYRSHSSSSTCITSYDSYCPTPPRSPHQTCSSNTGFEKKSGLLGFAGSEGNRKTSLKSMEFSDGGFHFNLPKMKDKSSEVRVVTHRGMEELRTCWYLSLVSMPWIHM